MKIRFNLFDEECVLNLIPKVFKKIFPRIREDEGSAETAGKSADPEHSDKKLSPAEISPPAVKEESMPSRDEDENPFSNPPELRRVIQAPVLIENLFPPESTEVLIKAQPSTNHDQCLFRINRPVLPGYSWWFGKFEDAQGSPLAERLFSIDGVEAVLVHEDTVTITRLEKTGLDWKPLAGEVGTAVREVMQQGTPLIAEKIIREMPSEDEIRSGIQRAIDTEVNPGVAGHGGNVTLNSIKGDTITIQMGGGCQGCSAADVTLKQGIHRTFREQVPFVGAIYDETDHAAGLNPYF